MTTTTTELEACGHAINYSVVYFILLNYQYFQFKFHAERVDSLIQFNNAAPLCVL